MLKTRFEFDQYLHFFNHFPILLLSSELTLAILEVEVNRILLKVTLSAILLISSVFFSFIAIIILFLISLTNSLAFSSFSFFEIGFSTDDSSP